MTPSGRIAQFVFCFSQFAHGLDSCLYGVALYFGMRIDGSEGCPTERILRAAADAEYED